MKTVLILFVLGLSFTSVFASESLDPSIACSCSNGRGQASAVICPKGTGFSCMLSPTTPSGWCMATCTNDSGQSVDGKPIPCPLGGGTGACNIISAEEQF